MEDEGTAFCSDQDFHSLSILLRRQLAWLIQILLFVDCYQMLSIVLLLCCVYEGGVTEQLASISKPNTNINSKRWRDENCDGEKWELNSQQSPGLSGQDLPAVRSSWIGIDSLFSARRFHGEVSARLTSVWDYTVSIRKEGKRRERTRLNISKFKLNR